MRYSNILILCLAVATAEAYITSSRSSFIGSKPLAFSASTGTMRMDLESHSLDYKARFNLEKTLMREIPSLSVAEAEAKHGMPWATSIDKNAFKDEELLYMPFWNWHLKFITENLTNVRVVSCSNTNTDFSYNENKGKKARIVNICLTSDEYRKIRMTYYDAGDNTQVYNAVCYPDPKYNLPVLGVDLLAFNRKKYLAIVDFQPLHQKEEDHSTTYEHLMQPVKESYDNLSGKMSSKFYDETQFFSQQMLFSRFEDEKIIENELFPAFQEYVKIHLDLIRNSKEESSDVNNVLKRQQEYDTYSAERDPATGLFTAMFGNDWAQDFVHDFLFSMSERKEGVRPAVPSFGGPPQHAATSHTVPAQAQQHTPIVNNRLQPVVIAR